MRRTLIIALFVAAWMVGPVARVQDGTAPTPKPTATANR